ncbi:MAG: iron-containing alcohol dehydrogenase [bacterium]|nr:iron-containing alcohol dehydrogenase [bacterium]
MLQAIRLISQNLVDAVRNPVNIESRTNMMQASLFAGLAFLNAGLGLAHAMA